MKTKTIELYEFDELSEDAKAKVLEQERYINVDYGKWCDFELDNWKDKLEELGFENPEINYRGFYSQGDGASFTCKSVNIELLLASQHKKRDFKELLKAIKKELVEVSASVIRIDRHYPHEYSVKGDVENSYLNNDEPGYTLQKQAQGLEDLITEVVRSLSRRIYSDLEDAYNGLTSDEAIIDTIKANGYTFRANGEMENS